MERKAKQATERERDGGQEWIGKELAAVKLPDARPDKRLRSLMERMSKGVGRGIPWAYQDWATTKAAHRFFSYGRVGKEQILAGHFQATRERAGCGRKPVRLCMTRRNSASGARIRQRWAW